MRSCGSGMTRSVSPPPLMTDAERAARAEARVRRPVPRYRTVPVGTSFTVSHGCTRAVPREPDGELVPRLTR